MNPSPKVRAILYLVGAFINAFTLFILAAGMQLSVWVGATVAGYNAVLALLARANVTETK